MTRKHDDTRIAHSGGGGERHHGVVNTPVYHVSTVTFPTVAALRESNAHPGRGVTYGRMGTPTTFALQDAVAELEGGGHTLALPSGLSAIATALLALLESGSHLLMVDTAYGPTRRFCDGLLASFGVETTYYDPAAGAAIESLLRPNTRAVFLESPGSLTFEVQDVPAIAAAARAHGAVTLMDNTWATPLYCKPLALGVDVSLQSVTKYIGGHSDLMLGTVTAGGETFDRVRAATLQLGLCAGPDDCYLALRGLRSLAARLARHQETGLALARWLQERPEVERVRHPALSGGPGHELWRRDFAGASGLFGVVLKPAPPAAVAAMLDGLSVFAMGYSWGGFESLIVPVEPAPRTATAWPASGPLLRIHAGLEHAADLIADLEAGFARLNAAA